MTRSAQLCSATVALVLAASGVAQAAALSFADRAFIPVLQRADGNLRDFAIVRRRQVNAQLDLVLALGTPHTVQKDDKEWFLWMKEDRLGVFLQDRRNPGLIFSLAIEPGPPCRIHLETVTDREVLISCPGEYGWGNSEPNQKFVFDMNSKRLTERYTYPPFTDYVLIGTKQGPVFVADDPHNLLAVSWKTANTFRFLSEAEASSIFEKISIVTNSGPGYRHRRPALPKKQRVPFGPEEKFELLLHGSGPGTTTGDPIVVENVDGAKREFPMPESSRTEWMSKRPEDVKHIIPASTAEIHEEIGPYQVEGDRLWFGKTFYNSEGSTGVGGFGYFDVRSLSYKFLEPREIWDWAVSALLVEPDAIWLGLVHYGEGADIAGGLLRWDRTTATVRCYALKAELHQIMRWRDALYLATGDGVEVLRGGEVDRYIIDSMPNGKFRVVECEGGYR